MSVKWKGNAAREQRSNQERAVRMLAQLYQRRDDLKALYGADQYAEALRLALGTVEHRANAEGTDPLSAALALAKTDNVPEIAAQFYLVGALELMERKEAARG